MCFLDSVPIEVQSPRLVTHRWLVLSSSFCGSGSPNLEPPGHGNSCHIFVNCDSYSFAMVANERA